MKKVALLSLLIMTSLCGCTAIDAPFKPSTGIIFTSYKAPLTTNFENTKYLKNSGRASNTFIGYSIFTISFGDSGLKKVMNDGYLDSVEYADYEFTQVLGIFSRTTVTAYGKEENRK